MSDNGSPLWPSIIDSASARKASKQGFWAAIYCSASAAVSGTLKFLFQANIQNDSIIYLINAVVFIVIGIGIYKMSRVAALTGCCLFIMERVYAWFSIGFQVSLLAWAILIVITMMFLNSCRGTFAYQKLITSKGDNTELETINEQEGT